MAARVRGGRAPTTIVDVGELLDENVIRLERHRMTTFTELEGLELVQWLARRSLLRNTYRCGTCEVLILISLIYFFYL